LSSSNACQSPDNRAFKAFFAVLCNILPSSVKEHGLCLSHYAVGAVEYEVFIGVAGPAPFPIPQSFDYRNSHPQFTRTGWSGDPLPSARPGTDFHRKNPETRRAKGKAAAQAPVGETAKEAAKQAACCPPTGTENAGKADIPVRIACGCFRSDTCSQTGTGPGGSASADASPGTGTGNQTG
jgi:hypothetical protein